MSHRVRDIVFIIERKRIFRKLERVFNGEIEGLSKGLEDRQFD